MKKRNPNRISELRLKRGWNQSELAERVGAHWVTVSKLERGQMQLTHEWMNRIAKALDVKAAELIADSPIKRTVYIHGLIDQNGEIIKVIGELDEDIYDAVPFAVEIGSPEPDGTVWYMIGNQGYYPFLQTGDLIRFTYQKKLNLEKAIRRLCLIEPKGGNPQKIVGVVNRGSSPELVDIQVMGGDLLADVAVEDIAVASMAIFEPEFDLDEDGYPRT